MNTINEAAERELRPCPFCGGAKLNTYAYDVQPDNFHSAYVECDDCEARGPNALTVDGWLSSKEEAISEAANAWNRRATLPPASGEAVRYEMRMCAPNGHKGPWSHASDSAYAKFSASPDIGDGFTYETRALFDHAQPAPEMQASHGAAVVAAPPVTPKHIEELKDILLWPVTEDDARVARDMLQSLHFDLSMAEGDTTPASPAPSADSAADARDAARYRFMMQWQDTDSQPQAIIEMWRKVYAEHRLKPTREDYETAIDAAIAAIQAQAGEGVAT